jgi:hypothetical protein
VRIAAATVIPPSLSPALPLLIDIAAIVGSEELLVESMNLYV